MIRRAVRAAQSVSEAAIATNTMSEPWRIELPAPPPLLHYARLQQVVIWPLRPAG